MRQRPLIIILFGAVVAAVLAATTIAVVASVSNGRDEHRRAESALTRDVANRLADTITGATQHLEGVRGLFEATGSVTPREFATFTAPIVERDPALIFISWSPRVTTTARAAFERRIGRQITVPESGGTPAPPTGVHFPIAFVSPGSSTSYLGTDPSSESVRAASLGKARASSAAQLSGPVELRGGGRGMIVSTPVYRRGSDGQAQLRGFVTGAYRLDLLGAGPLAAFSDGADIRVTDGDDTLFGAGGPVSVDATKARIEAAGRDWVVAVSRAGGPSVLTPAAVALGGLLLAALVATTLIATMRRESDAVAGRASAEDRLTSALARHDSILAAAGEGIIGVESSGRISFANPAAARLLQRPAAQLLGKRVSSFFRPDPAGDAATDGADDPIRAAMETGMLQRDDRLVVARGDGVIVPVEHTTAPLVEGEQTVGAVVSVRDVTDRRRLEEQVRRSLKEAQRRAAIDPLTGLANHRTFHERLAAEVERARRHGRGLSLVVMDLDHFKLVNDTHGHQEGDRILAALGEVMSRETRAGELLARVGGEEFALILPEADEMDAYQAAERIRNAISSTDFPPHGRITISAGVCGLAQAGDADRLYQLADGALYWAKNEGRDTVYLYSPEVVQALSAEERANRLQREQALMSIRILARAVDAKDPTTRRHSERVADLCQDLAVQLGWPSDRAETLREAGLVHDVGKIGVPDAILFKPDRLTKDEYEVVKQHAPLSAQIVAEALSDEQISWVRGHHERWDGTGYPDNLSGYNIPEGARIMALADAWDTILTERPYKPPSSADEAITECERFAGSQFWPAGVEALVASVAVFA